jgi:hypothetical protein
MSIISINIQNWEGHSERSEEALVGGTRILRFAQNDIALPLLVVNIHNDSEKDQQEEMRVMLQLPMQADIL